MCSCFIDSVTILVAVFEQDIWEDHNSDLQYSSLDDKYA